MTREELITKLQDVLSQYKEDNIGVECDIAFWNTGHRPHLEEEYEWDGNKMQLTE
jgi:hypothetical protein